MPFLFFSAPNFPRGGLISIPQLSVVETPPPSHKLSAHASSFVEHVGFLIIKTETEVFFLVFLQLQSGMFHFNSLIFQHF